MFLVMVQRMTAAFGSKSRTASFDRPTVWTVLWGLDEATRSKAQDFHLLGKSSQQKGVKNSFKICAKIKKNQPFCTKFHLESNCDKQRFMSNCGTT
jgi:hypothetical protein